MPIKTKMWRIDQGVQAVMFSAMEAERKLESLIEQDISIIDPDLMIIGRQVPTSFGKYIDLLAVDSEGHLAILEIKRDRTPREVVAQAIDYASWVQDLTYDDILEIYGSYDTTRNFEAAFVEQFGSTPPESINEEHRLLIVASELDNSTERIVNYLSSNYDVPINVAFFQYFKNEQGEYLSRTWLIDPVQTEAQSGRTPKARSKEPWNGTDYYVSFGDDPRRDWEDAVEFGYISAGGGRWYSNTLSQLHPGARIFVYIPQHGYVGVGIVTADAVQVKDFRVEHDGVSTPIRQLAVKARDMMVGADDPKRSEYLVAVNWIKTVTRDDGVWETGMFANQNSACRLRNKFTIERLTELFELDTLEASDDESRTLATIAFPLSIRARHKGDTFVAELLNIEGEITFNGNRYATPTTAAKVIVRDWKEVNGWDFWRYHNPNNDKWERIGKLR